GAFGACGPKGSRCEESPNRRKTIGLIERVGPVALRQAPITASGARGAASNEFLTMVFLRLFGEMPQEIIIFGKEYWITARDEKVFIYRFDGRACVCRLCAGPGAVSRPVASE
ncbi:MAG: hypothetical protein J5702_01585, partial [Bacteroidales bacterium]|nr:hypothetical protein [Bacteroidales bacterium]